MSRLRRSYRTVGLSAAGISPRRKAIKLSSVSSAQSRSAARIASFSQGPDGQLFLLGYEGTLFKVDFTGRKFE